MVGGLSYANRLAETSCRSAEENISLKREMRNPPPLPFHSLKSTEQRRQQKSSFQPSTEATLQTKAIVCKTGITVNNTALNRCLYFVSIFSFNKCY